MPESKVTLIPRRGRGRPPGSITKKQWPRIKNRIGYRIREFCEAVGVDRSTVKGAIERGEIKTTRIGRCEIVPAAEARRLGLVEVE